MCVMCSHFLGLNTFLIMLVGFKLAREQENLREIC